MIPFQRFNVSTFQRFLSVPVAIAVLLLGAHLTVTTAAGADLITATITLTNNPAGLTTNITLNGSTRYWTNAPAAVLSTHIQATNTIPMATTNLLNHLSAFPVDTSWYLSQTSPTNILIRGRVGQALTITVSPSPGWAFVTYSTQTVSSPTWTVRVPITVEAATNQTNIASLLTKAISDVSTQAFATNSTAVSNLLNKGASPQQYLASPVQFNGTLRAGKEVMLTNGFTKSVTNINSVSSNHVNFGDALRSEGSGGNSLQVGSNAMARGDFDTVIGNSALGSNGYNTVVGTDASATNGSGTAIGRSASANLSATSVGYTSEANTNGAAFGYNSAATGYRSTAIADSSSATAEASIAVGFASQATAAFAGAFGWGAVASALSSMSFGVASSATHSNSAAFGPPDHLGNPTSTTDTNQIRLGTSNHRISAPGLYESPKGTNSQFAGTNIARGSWSHPAFALNTLAAGNNISVPAGTNVYIRCGAGPASAATICGIIGGATSGGLDGQMLEVMNDTGFTLTFAVSTVDPVAANRINTPLGTDVSIADQGWAYLRYDGTDSRWKVIGTFPLQATATNALSSIFTNGVVVAGNVTNLNLIYGNGIDARTTNASGNVAVELRSKHYRLFTLTNNVTVTNTVAATSLITNALWGNQIIPANTLIPGAVVRVRLAGFCTSVGGTHEIGIRFNNGTLIATNLQTLAATLVNDNLELNCDIVVRASGGSGSVLGKGMVHTQTATGAANPNSGRRLQMGLLQSAATVDTTIDQVIDAYIIPGATTQGFTITQCIVEILQ